jgi:hypothetical protein
MGELKAVCVYCGSGHGDLPAYADAAWKFGELLAEREITLVFGGGHIGLMGAVADAVLEAGGRVEGVIPKSLVERELAHPSAQEMHVVESMHDRKALMAELSDAFVALPGGIGTLDELFEIWTWRQLGFHNKPLGLLDVEGYWQPLIKLADHMEEHDFVRGNTRGLLLDDTNPVALLEKLAALIE